MRKLISSFALAAFLTTVVAFAAPQVPRKVPEFVFHMPGGSQKLLSEYKGKTIVLALMFTTCPHCQKTAGVLTTIQDEYKDKGVQMLGAAFDDGAELRVRNFTTQFKVGFPVGWSTALSTLEFVQHPVNEPYFVPILVFIDKTGMIRSQYIGDEHFLNHQEINIRQEIDWLLKGAPSPHPAVK